MNTMISIDTNVIVRLLVGDHEEQSPRAKSLFESEQIFIAQTVLLETDWVLRVRYDFEKPAVISALRQLLRLANVITEDASRAVQALDWAEGGMDFADALHLAAPSAGIAFASFDKKLAKVAARLGATLVREP